MRAFLSHVSDEGAEARALKRALEEALPSAEVFVSAADIHLGDAWLNEIDQSLKSAKLVLALCSPNSVRRPWLNFESGTGWTRGLPVIPVCHKGLRMDRLPDPLGIFQATELADAESCRTLVSRIGSILETPPAPGFDPIRFLQQLKIERPPRTSEIGIVLAHRQREWEEGENALLSLATARAPVLNGDWVFREIGDERAFLSTDLHKLSGLIFASPWRARIEPETITATVEWVREGGRILFLGFELGDRHHNANLAELTHHFGIDPASDIVGPPGFGEPKPYEVIVDYHVSEAEAHPLTHGLTTIRLVNVQTVRVEPGGIEWLRVGRNNLLYRPRRETVRYRDGTLTTPGGTAFERIAEAGWLPVAVEAPAGLCGRGRVLMVGSWDLLGRSSPFGGDNVALVSRLLDWLARKAG